MNETLREKFLRTLNTSLVEVVGPSEEFNLPSENWKALVFQGSHDEKLVIARVHEGTTVDPLGDLELILKTYYRS